VRSLVQGARLHLREDDGELRRQLASLRATELSSGGLRVESRKDDAADACAIACEIAVLLDSTDGPSGTAHQETSIHWHGHAGLEITHRWTKNGFACAPPEWHPTFEEHALQMLSRGIRNAAIERWLAKQPEAIRRAYAINPLEPVQVRALGDPNVRSERINAKVKF
jgi:hypothetical protein